MGLDIGGFFTSPDFLRSIAEFISMILTALFGGVLSGLFGTAQ